MSNISIIDLFNYIQDYRHLVIVDLRSKAAYESAHIRQSITIYQPASDFIQQVKFIEEKAKQNEQKYKLTPIKRVICIHQDVNVINQQAEVIKELAMGNLQDCKMLFLKEPFSKFEESFPFLLVSKDILNQYDLMNPINDTNLLTPIQRQVLYSYSMFPQILIQNEILIGCNINANSKQQLNDLHIKTLVDLNFYEEVPQLGHKEEFNYTPIPIQTKLDLNIDFDEINYKIDELPKPILIYCQDGNSLTNLIAISYLMYKKKLQCNIASLKVFQIRGSTSINKKLYSQLMIYQPGSQVKIIKQ